MRKTKNGFTLIELLVVIAIISLLSSIIFASLNSARSKARDAQRLTEMNQLRAAIEMFYVDKGYYPQCPKTGGGGFPLYCSTTGWNGGNDLATLQVVPTYMSSIPVDPLNDTVNNTYGYYYAMGYTPAGNNTWIPIAGLTANQHYIICTRLENSSNPLVAPTVFGNPNLNFLVGQ